MTDLTALSSRELLALFADLETPDLAELDGEYAARLLAQPAPLLKQAYWSVVHNPVVGDWLGKAFDGAPSGGDTGRGYNYFRQRGRVVRRYPMLTCIAPSRFDGKPAFQLVYRAFHSPCATVNMIDEVRRVEPGRYLGIGTACLAGRLRPGASPAPLSWSDLVSPASPRPARPLRRTA